MWICWPNTLICVKDHEENNHLKQKHPCSYKLWPKKYLFIPKYADDRNIILLWTLNVSEKQEVSIPTWEQSAFLFLFRPMTSLPKQQGLR